VDGLVRGAGRSSGAVALLLALVLARAAAATDAPAVPPLPLREAIRLAEEWARAGGVDLSAQHLSWARLCVDEAPGRRGRYWHLQWTWTSPRLGGEFGARVYMDGLITPQPCGP